MQTMRSFQKQIKKQWFSHTKLTSTYTFNIGIWIIWMGRLGHQAAATPSGWARPTARTDGCTDIATGAGAQTAPVTQPGKEDDVRRPPPHSDIPHPKKGDTENLTQTTTLSLYTLPIQCINIYTCTILQLLQKMVKLVYQNSFCVKESDVCCMQKLPLYVGKVFLPLLYLYCMYL